MKLRHAELVSASIVQQRLSVQQRPDLVLEMDPETSSG
jgi:hypothetical protein